MPSPKSFLEDERCFRLRVLCFVVLVLLVVLMILEVFFEGCDVSVDSDVVGGCVNLLRLFCVLSWFLFVFSFEKVDAVDVVEVDVDDDEVDVDDDEVDVDDDDDVAA